MVLHLHVLSLAAIGPENELDFSGNDEGDKRLGKLLENWKIERSDLNVEARMCPQRAIENAGK
jgi:hypothetical protein